MRGRFCTQPFLVEGGACRPITFLLLPRWVSRSPPHPPQCAHWGTFPPRGRLWAWVRPFPTTTPTFPSPPSWGAGRYGRWIMGRRPGKKEGGPPQGPPNQKRWVQGGRTSSSLVFFPPAFFQRKPGSPAGVGGGGIPPLPEPTQHGRGLPHPGGLLLHHRRHPGGLLGGHCRAVYLPERRYPLPHPAGHDPLCPPGGF